MPDANEAKRLWNLMCQLEREQPPRGADLQAKLKFNENKHKEMMKLKKEYDKATNLNNPVGNADWNQSVSQRKIQQSFRGESGPLTSDNM